MLKTLDFGERFFRADPFLDMEAEIAELRTMTRVTKLRQQIECRQEGAWMTVRDVPDDRARNGTRKVTSFGRTTRSVTRSFTSDVDFDLQQPEPSREAIVEFPEELETPSKPHSVEITEITENDSKPSPEPVISSSKTSPTKKTSVVTLGQGNVVLIDPQDSYFKVTGLKDSTDEDVASKPSSNKYDKKVKKVGFSKTEVHFAPDSGKVNIVETDEKPPSSQVLRRKKKPRREPPKTTTLPKLYFGDAEKEKFLLVKNPTDTEKSEPEISSEFSHNFRVIREPSPLLSTIIANQAQSRRQSDVGIVGNYAVPKKPSQSRTDPSKSRGSSFEREPSPLNSRQSSLEKERNPSNARESRFEKPLSASNSRSSSFDREHSPSGFRRSSLEKVRVPSNSRDIHLGRVMSTSNSRCSSFERELSPSDSSRDHFEMSPNSSNSRESRFERVLSPANSRGSSFERESSPSKTAPSVKKGQVSSNFTKNHLEIVQSSSNLKEPSIDKESSSFNSEDSSFERVLSAKSRLMFDKGPSWVQESKAKLPYLGKVSPKLSKLISNDIQHEFQLKQMEILKKTREPELEKLPRETTLEREILPDEGDEDSIPIAVNVHVTTDEPKIGTKPVKILTQVQVSLEEKGKVVPLPRTKRVVSEPVYANNTASRGVTRTIKVTREEDKGRSSTRVSDDRKRARTPSKSTLVRKTPTPRLKETKREVAVVKPMKPCVRSTLTRSDKSEPCRRQVRESSNPVPRVARSTESGESAAARTKKSKEPLRSFEKVSNGWVGHCIVPVQTAKATSKTFVTTTSTSSSSPLASSSKIQAVKRDKEVTASKTVSSVKTEKQFQSRNSLSSQKQFSLSREHLRSAKLVKELSRPDVPRPKSVAVRPRVVDGPKKNLVSRRRLAFEEHQAGGSAGHNAYVRRDSEQSDDSVVRADEEVRAYMFNSKTKVQSGFWSIPMVKGCEPTR